MRGYRICTWMSANACWRRSRRRPRRDLESITPPCNWSEQDCRRNRDTLCRSRQKIKIEERGGKSQLANCRIKIEAATKKYNCHDPRKKKSSRRVKIQAELVIELLRGAEVENFSRNTPAQSILRDVAQHAVIPGISHREKDCDIAPDENIFLGFPARNGRRLR